MQNKIIVESIADEISSMWLLELQNTVQILHKYETFYRIALIIFVVC